MERLLAQQEGDDSFKASADVVRNEIKTQLDTAARFTPQANDSYAALAGSFYAVQAARMGMTPEELYRQYPLQVMAQTPTFEAPALVTRGAYNQLVDISQDTDRGKQRIQALAEWAQKQLEKEGFTADLQHSGSTAGPSSYLDVTDLHTGSKLDRQLRFSGHSKGAYQHQFIHDLGSEAEVLALIEELKAQRTPERIEAYQAFLARMEEKQAQQNEARTQELARLMEVETQRLQRAEEKEAKGEPLSKMDRKVLKARDEGRLLRDGGSKYWQSTEAPFRAPEIRNEQGQLLAPNGQVSKLNERQWHQVRSPQFKAWFGDWENDPKNASKVVDENGEPLVVYHGTDADFTAFDPARSRAAEYGGKGFFFTASREVADRFGAKAMPVFLSAKTGLPEKRAARQAGIAINVDHIRPANDERDIWVVFSPNQIKSATDNNGAFDVDNSNILLQRSQETKAAYEARIDELFTGKAPSLEGVRVLDRGDVLSLLGYEDKPVVLAEGKVKAGMENHPLITAEVWKKVPDWLENPAAVFDSDTAEGLVFIAPELIAGRPVSIIVRPDAGHPNTLHAHVLLNAYERSASTPFLRWMDGGLLRFIDQKKFPAVFESTSGRRLPGTALQNKPGMRKILTEKNLAGYRKEHSDVLFARQQPGITRGFFDPSSNTIGLLKDADLSTFLHEAGHFFLEMQVDLASRVQQEADLFGADTNTEGREQIAQDMQILLDWFGVRDLAEWHNMDMEQKRSYHEQFARGFEAYLYEGKAPSIELQGLFQRFRAWLVNVYKSLRSLNVELSDDVRGVFDRMLASNEQIALAEQGRSMLPLFESAEQAGMTTEEFAAYQAQGTQATADAIQELQARGLRDMQWLHNARGREMKRLQKQAKELRNEVQMQVRNEVMRQPVYRAWQFLTNRMTEDERLSSAINPNASTTGLDESHDLLLTAIAKLGGLNKEEVVWAWGVDPGERIVRPVFGKPVLRKRGGLSIDAMGEALSLDENGQWEGLYGHSRKHCEQFSGSHVGSREMQI